MKGKENLIKHQKAPKYYENDCRRVSDEALVKLSSQNIGTLDVSIYIFEKNNHNYTEHTRKQLHYPQLC